MSCATPHRMARLLSVNARSESSGIQVRKAVHAAALADTRLIRHEVYCLEKGFLRPDALLDSYDDEASVWNSYVDGDPAATLRITDSRKTRLEIYQMHPELEEHAGGDKHLLEVSRLMVRKPYRGFRATFPLFREVYKEMVLSGADGLIISCARGLIPYYRGLMGFELLDPAPLTHAHLNGLKDYAMIWELRMAHRTTLSQSLGILCIAGPSELIRMKRAARTRASGKACSS